ncbi:TPA: hypothetical protein ACH4W3_000422 [Campylobacter lari]
MTAYVHIGTVKTGTTTIQKFLFLNKSMLKNFGFLISEYFGAPITYGKDEFFDSFANENWEKCYKENIANFYQEINNSKANKILISSEGLHAHLLRLDDVEKFRKFLLSTGKISKIKIIIYLREPSSMAVSLYSELIKNAYAKNLPLMEANHKDRFIHDCDYKTIQIWASIFGKENIVVRLFDQDEFHQEDLLKDFIYSIDLNWDSKFIIPIKQNESLDLIGIKLLSHISRENSKNGVIQLWHPFCRHFQSKDPFLKFNPPKEIMQSYIDYFEESNEWVRKEFFPHKERLFPKKDLSNYKENYELKEMKPEYWDKIAEFIADIVKTKNQAIIDKEQTIQNQKNKIQILEQANGGLDKYSKHSTAKSRIQNQLSYKLGQAMIVNSKSFLGYIRMPFVLSYIKDKHKQEQKIYQEKIKKDPSLALPPLESYPDYKEALKEKECFTYKLGQALIQANKTWYGGGYIKLLFEIRKLKREVKEKVNHV